MCAQLCWEYPHFHTVYSIHIACIYICSMHVAHTYIWLCAGKWKNVWCHMQIFCCCSALIAAIKAKTNSLGSISPPPCGSGRLTGFADFWISEFLNFYVHFWIHWEEICLAFVWFALSLLPWQEVYSHTRRPERDLFYFSIIIKFIILLYSHLWYGRNNCKIKYMFCIYVYVFSSFYYIYLYATSRVLL